MVLDGWQELVLQAAMGERTDGTWAARRIGLSVPRQNGKSQLMVARALAGALLFEERKIVISAHQQDTARESFTKLLEIIEADANDWLRERIRPNGIMQALNREAVRFSNGATIQFKARSGSGSRGFSSDCLMLDEAQILSQRAWVSINSTMSAMPNPQVWLLGTPPTPEDDGAVFSSVRESAKAGTSTATAWLEWAADPTADPALEETRWSANPAWCSRINHEVVQGEFETYPPDRFALDRLGIWLSDAAISIFPTWSTLVSLDHHEPEALGVAGDVTGKWFSLGAFGDGHLGAVRRFRSDEGRLALLSETKRIASERRLSVAVQVPGPAAPLAGPLRDAGVDVIEAKFPDVVQACADLREAVETGAITHGDHEDLNEAVRNAQWRSVNDQLVISRKAADVSMLEAVTLARWAAANATTTEPFALWG